nr:hypothetical protein [Brevundimonas diminuta]
MTTDALAPFTLPLRREGDAAIVDATGETALVIDPDRHLENDEDAARLADLVFAMLTAAPVREEGGAVETALKIATDLHHAYEQLIYGLPKYLEAENLTDEENMIREAWITLDVTAHRIAALATREEEPASAERRECDDCGFKGTSDDASKEQDYCTACGGNSPAGGPDDCAHCGAKNHMVMACPKCGGRFSPDEGGHREAPAEAGEIGAEYDAAAHCVTLAECPPGLFLWNGTLGFKSEYGAMEPVGISPHHQQWKVGNRVDAYCADSGEYFWGGTSNHDDRAKLLVYPIDADVVAMVASHGPSALRAHPQARSGEGQ